MNDINIALVMSSNPIFWIGMSAVFGACVASFINLFAWRWPQMMQREWLADIKEWFEEQNWAFPKEAQLELDKPEMTLSKPGSHCPACQSKIPFWSNIPVLGWLILRGKAFCCKSPISPRYPLGEALGALTCGLAAYHFGATWQAPLAMIALLTLQASAFTDLESYLLPDSLTGFLLFLGLGASCFGFWPIAPTQAFLGMVVGYFILEALRIGGRVILKKEAMGQGDPKLLAAIGVWVGPFALTPVLLIASLSAIFIAILARLFFGQNAKGARIPFGPYLAIGGAALILAHTPILRFFGMIP